MRRACAARNQVEEAYAGLTADERQPAPLWLKAVAVVAVVGMVLFDAYFFQQIFLNILNITLNDPWWKQDLGLLAAVAAGRPRSANTTGGRTACREPVVCLPAGRRGSRDIAAREAPGPEATAPAVKTGGFTGNSRDKPTRQLRTDLLCDARCSARNRRDVPFSFRNVAG